MGSRRHKRVAMKLPVKVWGMNSDGQPFVSSASTLDISNRGARLAGVPSLPKAGEIVGVQYKNLKSRFRVVWVGQPNTSRQGQIGLESVEDRDIWGVPLVPTWIDTYVQNSASQPALEDDAAAQNERRFAHRWTFEGGVQFWKEGTDFPTWARVTDVSLGGCYVEMMMPMPAGTKLRLILNLNDLKLPAAGMVRTSHPGIGMGVMFTDMAEEHRSELEKLIHHMEGREDVPQAAPSASQPAHTAEAAAGFPDLTLSPQASKTVLQQLMGWFHCHDDLSRAQFILFVNSRLDQAEKAADGKSAVLEPALLPRVM